MTRQDNLRMVLLGALTFLLYGFFNSFLPITDPVESNYVLTAKEMFLRGDWLTPYIYGAPWFDKPIWTYWMLLLSFKIFGSSDFAARFPSTLAASLSVMALYTTGLQVFRRSSAALWTALVTATSLAFWYISHGVITDGYLFLATVGIFSFSLTALRQGSLRHMCLAYACAGVAVLVKGPVGLVLPGMILAAYLLGPGERRRLKLLFHPAGLAVFALIAVPWYLAMYHLHGTAYMEQFLGLHNYVRATVSEHPRSNVWYYYLLLWPVMFLPWTGMVLRGLRFRSGFPLNRWCLFWGLGVVLFYSFMATKYVTYTFICMIPFVLYGAHGLETLEETPFRIRSGRFLSLVLPFLLLALSLIAAGHIFSGRADTAGGMWTIGLITVLTPAYGIRTRSWRKLALSIAVATALIYSVLLLMLPGFLRVHTGKYLAERLEAPPRAEVLFYGSYSASYIYYSGGSAAKLISAAELENVWNRGKDVMPLRTWDELESDLARDPGKPVLVIMDVKDVDSFLSRPVSHRFALGQEIDDYRVYRSR